MRVLLLCSRDPGGRRAGRKMVIRTIIGSLRGLGHEVELGVIGFPAGDEPGADEPLTEIRDLVRHAIPGPSLPRVALNVLTRFSRGRLSLNECLFFSPAGHRRVTALAGQRGYDLVITDMIRAVPLAAGVEVPLIADLDDRLSHRYEGMLHDANGHEDLLGYVTPRVPAWLRAPAVALASRLLAREARVLHRREVATARRADGVSLVSGTEAASLAADSGRAVATLPMAMAIPPTPVDVASNDPDTMVFVGGLDYHANAEGMRWFAAEVLPLIIAARPHFEVTAIGECPPRLRAELARTGLRLTGYVPNLTAELGRQFAFVAPLLSGHGVKTKVLEAMAAGLPVIGTPQAFTGLEAVDGENCRIVDSPQAFTEAVIALAADRQAAARIGACGRAYVAARFAPEVLQAAWSRMLASVVTDVTRGGEATQVVQPVSRGSRA